MKPILLEIQAFGPYVEKQTVDFEKLSGKGMFLIKGKTGSGKTTLFDAMVFALYGGSSGEDAKSKTGRNDLEQWRCTQAGPDTPTFVSFTFESNRHIYKFTRRLDITRTGKLAPRYEAGEIDGEGNVMPFFSNPKKDDLTEKAVELIGLTRDQFRQVVMLPQGQFERFLLAPSDEKEVILQKIFGADRWGKFSQAFFERAKSVKDALDREKSEVITSLAEENLPDTSALSELIESKKLQLKDLEKEYTTFDCASKQNQLNRDIELAQMFSRLHSDEKKLALLEGKKDETDAKAGKYALAEKAEALREVLDAFDRASGQKTLRADALKAVKSKLPAAEKSAADAKSSKETHDASLSVEEKTRTLGEYEAKRESYGNIASLNEALELAHSLTVKAASAFSVSEKKLNEAVDSAKTAHSAFEKADEQARTFRQAYFAGIYGEIASGLESGAPCPVCGSTSHPNPAAKAPDSVSKDDLDKAETAAEDARNVWSEAEKVRETAGSEKEEKEKTLTACREKETEALQKRDAVLGTLIDGIPDLDTLEERILSINNEISAYKSRSENLQKLLEKAVSDLEGVRNEIEHAAHEDMEAGKILTDAEKALISELKSKGFSTRQEAAGLLMSAEAREKIHSEIVEYKTSVINAQEAVSLEKEKLSGFSEPDSGKFEERQQEIQAVSDNYNSKKSALETEIKRLSGKLKTLRAKEDHYKNELPGAEDDLAFAKKLRGDTDTGLQRYVLAIMFNQVIGEANRMLSKVHGGRYYLFRTDDKGIKRKKGLELKVHDNRSPDAEGRSVSMLSGGEKFLVSLALSIGMSTVAQKSGVKIEALFIDEGFGTLDDNSINDAMDVLESVRKSSGMIGIISHVPLLEASIPAQLEVIKADAGSSVVIR